MTVGSSRSFEEAFTSSELQAAAALSNLPNQTAMTPVHGSQTSDEPLLKKKKRGRPPKERSEEELARLALKGKQGRPKKSVSQAERDKLNAKADRKRRNDELRAAGEVRCHYLFPDASLLTPSYDRKFSSADGQIATKSRQPSLKLVKGKKKEKQRNAP